MTHTEKCLLKASALASQPEHNTELIEYILECQQNQRVLREELYEVLIQIHLFAGFPAAIEAARALDKAWPVRPDTSHPNIASEFETHDYRSKGLQLFSQVYAEKSDVVQTAMSRLSPELSQWSMTDGYGKTLLRPGLSIRVRELAIVTVLTQLGWKRQLLSHILGAGNVGNSIDDIQKAIEIGSLQSKEKELIAKQLLAHLK